MNISRRDLMKKLLGGGVGLTALATGLPLSFLRHPLAYGGEETPACPPSSGRGPQYLILASNELGDPVNANAPGSYAFPGIAHPPTDDFAATPISLGSSTVTGARVWGTLPAWVRDRACFIHHATRSGAHPEMSKVLRLFGALQNNEMLPSAIASRMAPCLSSIQSAPVNVGDRVSLEARGAALPRLTPTALKQLLLQSNSPLASLRTLRAQKLDEINGLLKTHGTPAQRRFLDERARTQSEVQHLAQDSAALFQGINDDSQSAQLTAALGLIRLNVSPVVSVSLRFGGDNHQDTNLAREASEHVSAIAAIGTIMEQIRTAGLDDRVSFAMMNVFGRTLARKGTSGRDHEARHAVSLLIGPAIRGGVVGGLGTTNDDYTSLGFDGATGQSVPGGGDIRYEETLAAVGATLYAAVGLSAAASAADFRNGKIIGAALAG